VTVNHGGRSFVATAEMAEIFANRADAAVSSGRSELVPLSHRDGLELLLVGPGTRYTIVELAEAGPAIDSEPATGSETAGADGQETARVG
jgi:hypothetical protein